MSGSLETRLFGWRGGEKTATRFHVMLFEMYRVPVMPVFGSVFGVGWQGLCVILLVLVARYALINHD